MNCHMIGRSPCIVRWDNAVTWPLAFCFKRGMTQSTSPVGTNRTYSSTRVIPYCGNQDNTQDRVVAQFDESSLALRVSLPIPTRRASEAPTDPLPPNIASDMTLALFAMNN